MVSEPKIMADGAREMGVPEMVMTPPGVKVVPAMEMALPFGRGLIT